MSQCEWIRLKGKVVVLWHSPGFRPTPAQLIVQHDARQSASWSFTTMYTDTLRNVFFLRLISVLKCQVLPLRFFVCWFVCLFVLLQTLVDVAGVTVTFPQEFAVLLLFGSCFPVMWADSEGVVFTRLKPAERLSGRLWFWHIYFFDSCFLLGRKDSVKVLWREKVIPLSSINYWPCRDVMLWAREREKKVFFGDRSGVVNSVSSTCFCKFM